MTLHTPSPRAATDPKLTAILQAVLKVLADSPRPLNLNEICNNAKPSRAKATLDGTLSRLVEAGWAKVDWEQPPGARRPRRIWQITPTGTGVYEAAQAAQNA